MRPKWSCSILGGLLLVCSLSPLLVSSGFADEEIGDGSQRSLDSGIELSELDYEDSCLPAAEAQWTFLHEPADPFKLLQWKNETIKFAQFKKSERLRMKEKFNATSFDEPALAYKLGVIKEPGDAVLEDEDFSKLVSFIGENRALRATSRYSDGTKNLTQQEVEYLLSHNGKAEEKLKAWATWHQHFASEVDSFSSVLRLAEKAAKAYDPSSSSGVSSYWEMLTGEPDAYDSFRYQLDRITDLRMKLMYFAQKRLAKKYDVPMKNDSIPAHLLGSLAGNDWTHLALDVVPHRDVIFDIRKNFWEKKLMGKYLYKSASELGKKLLAKTPESEFWTDSYFRAGCPPTLVSFCKLGKMKVSTCNEPSLSNYLTAHKNVAKVLLHQMSSKVPILNDVNRYSVLEEALGEFLSILAASPAWLQHLGLMDKSVGSEEAKITSLAITALDVLPRLNYYITADKWRLDVIEKNVTDAKQLVSEWWSNRLHNEFVSTEPENEVPTFLSDDHIVSNKPYLSKVLGIVLAFQMYNYVLKETQVRHEPFDKRLVNRDLVWMVHNSSENWKDLVNKFMSIESISAEPMSDFFDALYYYFESYQEPEEPYDSNAKELELEKIEKHYRKIINAPTTTTTTTTTHRPQTRPTKHIPKDSLILVKSAEHKPPAPPATERPVNRNVYLEENEAMLEDEASIKKPKINTSKAVWAVAAVLVVTILICIIAIFGRRRCSRTPKNRRYV